MQIRPVTVDDAPSVATLMNRLSASALQSTTGPWSADDCEAWLATLPEGSLHLGAVDNERGLIGIQQMRPAGKGVAEIDTFIALEHQSEGVGTQLFEAMRQRMEVVGTHMVWATIRPHQRGALHYYRRLGFEVVEVQACRVRVRWRDVGALQHARH